MPSGYTIRPAQPDDIPPLPAIERRAARLFCTHFEETGLTAASLEHVNSVDDFERARQAGCLWVAEAADGEIVGFALVLDFGNYAHLEELDVLPDHSQRGLGSALLSTVCHWARRSGYGAVTLRTFRTIPWNAPFYERRGFRVVESAQLSTQHVALETLEQQRGLRTDLRVTMALSYSD